MYLDLFKLREFPFRLTPDLDFLFMSSAHARAKAYMDYTVWNREGFVVITGEIGCGKTTLIQKLLSELDNESVLVAKLFQTQLDETEFLQAVLVEFGLNPFSAKKVELIDMLNTFLVENFSRDRQIVLIVDDAHNLSVRVLEELRMLSGLETQKEKILHIILVGQPQLNDTLDSPELEQLLQRVRLRFHIKSLSEDDTAQYIEHRLHVAGSDRANVFAADAVPLIHRYTGGIPRLINTLCDTAMICAYADSMDCVDATVVQSAVEELQWLPYAKRVNAKRIRERNRQGSTGPDAPSQLVPRISNRLNQLDALVPALSLMSDRLGSIEALLKTLVDVMVQDREGRVPAKIVKRE